MRLFVAVVPPAGVLDVVAGALDRPDVPGLRWTTREQWHVTLRFLGRVDDPDAVAGALAPLDTLACEAALGPATARLGRAVLHLPVAGLDALAAEVARRTAGFGEPPDDRPFTGHLTLARARGRSVVGAAQWRPLVGRPATARWTVDEVVLMESRLHPDGARYSPVGRVALPGAGA